MARQRELEQRVVELEAEVARLKKGFFHPSTPQTVITNGHWDASFHKAQHAVDRFFQDVRADPAKGCIEIGQQRYVLVRASTLSLDFLDMVMGRYADRGTEEALATAHGLLFDIAHSLGINDARAIHREMGLHTPMEKVAAGPVHFAYSGWALVEFKPPTNPASGDDCLFVFDHPYSFEADAWLAAGRTSDTPVCIMNAGYASGWVEESFGQELTAVEVACRARGDATCTFVAAPPQRIAQRLEEHFAAQGHSPPARPPFIPSFFHRKKAEEALRRSEERLRRVIESMPAMMMALDANGSIVVWNRECERVTGFSAEEMVGDPTALQRLLVNPSAAQRILSECQSGGTGYRNWECAVRCKTGPTKTVSWSNISHQFPIAGWATWTVGVDITSQKQMQARLAHADHMASVGILAAGVAHQLNSPLCVIEGYANLLLETLGKGPQEGPLDPDLRRKISKIKTSADRCRNIVDNLLCYSRPSETTPKSVSLAAAARSALSLLEEQRVEKNVHVHNQLSEDLSVQASPGQLEQIFANVMLNGIQAMNPNGELTIAGGQEPNGWVEVTVHDTGPGIPEKDLSQVFAPFFTTKPLGEGTGLGLSLVYGLVERLHGSIAAERAPSGGALFRIRLPQDAVR